MKKALSVILCLCFIISVFSAVPSGASAAESSAADVGAGDWDPYELETGTIYWGVNEFMPEWLMIKGTGYMKNFNQYNLTDRPWDSIKDKITTLSVYENVVSIGDYAFSGFSKLNFVTLPDTLKRIGKHSFEYCTSLFSLTIPSSVKTIQSCAFLGCDKLMYVTVPETVTTIEEYALGYETNTGDIFGIGMDLSKKYSNFYIIGTRGTEAERYAKANGINFNDEHPEKNRTGSCNWGVSFSRLFISGNGQMGDYYTQSRAPWYGDNYTWVEIEDGVTNIGENAFCSDKVTLVTIGKSVKTIGTGAFAGCTNLSGVTIPDSVETIGERAFYNCRELSSLTLGEKVKKIDSRAFCGCAALKEVTIPKSVTSIGSYALGYNVDVNGNYIKNKDFTIKGYEGSEAQRYANANGFIFTAIKDNAFTVKGTITSYLSETDSVSVLLMKNGSVVKNAIIKGTSADYSFSDVAKGDYILKISKKNHTSLEEKITVDNKDITRNIKLCPLGDVNNDGKTTQTDYVLAMSYVRKTKDLTDYQIKCGDVFGSGDGKLTAQDANRIVQHTRKVKLLY